MRCEGCKADLGIATLQSPFLQYSRIAIKCPICGLTMLLYCKGNIVETDAEHARKLKSWKKGDKNDQESFH